MNPVVVRFCHVCYCFHRCAEPVRQVCQRYPTILTSGCLMGTSAMRSVHSPPCRTLTLPQGADWATPSCLATCDCEKPCINKSTAHPLSLSGIHDISRCHVAKQILMEWNQTTLRICLIWLFNVKSAANELHVCRGWKCSSVDHVRNCDGSVNSTLLQCVYTMLVYGQILISLLLVVKKIMQN